MSVVGIGQTTCRRMVASAAGGGLAKETVFREGLELGVQGRTGDNRGSAKGLRLLPRLGPVRMSSVPRTCCRVATV